MGKAKAPRRLADNEARAVTRTIRISPQKLNLVAALIRGKKASAALADLETLTAIYRRFIVRYFETFGTRTFGSAHDR